MTSPRDPAELETAGSRRRPYPLWKRLAAAVVAAIGSFMVAVAATQDFGATYWTVAGLCGLRLAVPVMVGKGSTPQGRGAVSPSNPEASRPKPTTPPSGPSGVSTKGSDRAYTTEEVLDRLDPQVRIEYDRLRAERQKGSP